jgi:hypothetical protein
MSNVFVSGQATVAATGCRSGDFSILFPDRQQSLPPVAEVETSSPFCFWTGNSRCHQLQKWRLLLHFVSGQATVATTGCRSGDFFSILFLDRQQSLPPVAEVETSPFCF